MQYPSDPNALYQPSDQTQAPPQKTRRLGRNGKIAIGCGALILLILIFSICTSANKMTQQVAQNASPAAQKTSLSVTPTPIPPTSTPTLTPVPPTPTLVPPTPTPLPVHYPPKTVGDLHELAAKGDANAIHAFHSESVGLAGACPQPKREITVDPGITGQQLAKDLLAYFYTQHLDSPCGSIVFAYHNQSEANDAYTAGRINFDANDASGSPNVDPNATDLRYTLILDVGGLMNQQEYIINY